MDENLNWRCHIKFLENKISKSLGLLYKAKFLLSKKCLLNIYFSFIHCYLNYANAAWASNHSTHLKKINSQQKHAIRIINNEQKYTHARPLLRESKILNAYQLNILSILTFICTA